MPTSLPPSYRPPPHLKPRSWRSGLWRGLRGRCPACGRGTVFSSYLKVVTKCGSCGERLGHIRADDGPAYFTVLVVGHVVVPLVALMERMLAPPMALQAAVWLPVTAILCLLLLPRFKGGVVGLMWGHRLSGRENLENGESLR